MDPWSAKAEGGGGYFTDGETPSKGKAVTRQQFLCPVTIRQLLEAPEDGLKVGSYTAAMVTIAGVVLSVENESTKIRFTLSDDTGVIDCFDWLESEDGEEQKTRDNIMENAYYQVYGCMKSMQGTRHVMVFKVAPIENFNDFSAFMVEVLSVNQYAQKMNGLTSDMAMDTSTSTFIPNNHTNNDNYGTPFNAVQKAVLDAIKAVNSQVGWSKNDPVLRSKFSNKLVEEALDFLVGEGHIYSTIDDDHYCST